MFSWWLNSYSSTRASVFCLLIISFYFLRKTFQCWNKFSNKITTKDRQWHFNYINSRFQLHEFTISTSRIRDFNFTNSRIPEFNFMNSISRIHEFNFTNSASRIHEFNFPNSRIQLHEFNFPNSRIQLHEFTNSTSRIQLHEFNHEFSCWIREVEFVNSWRGIREVEFVKLNSWIREVEFVKLNSGICEVEIVNSWSLNLELMKLKCHYRSFVDNCIFCIVLYCWCNGLSFIVDCCVM